jgi:hypothetical protein
MNPQILISTDEMQMAARRDEPCLPSARTPGLRRHAPDMLCIMRQWHNTGWRWRVMISRKQIGRTFTKAFSDRTHGGEEAALAAARAWRDDVLRRYPPASKVELAVLVRKHNTSGRPGVFRRTMHKSTKDGRRAIHVFWQAQTPLCVTPMRTRSFSVAKFGEDGAYRLAVAAREEFEALLDDDAGGV